MKVDANGNETINLVSLQRFGHLFNFKCDYELIEKALLCYGDYAPRKNNIRPYGGWNWRLWRSNILGSGDDNTRKILQKFLSNEPYYSNASLEKIIRKFLGTCESNEIYTWTYYMVNYDNIRHATYSKYRYKGGNYTYQKLNANGGGGNEKYWNPFNLMLGELLKPDFSNSISDTGGSLHLISNDINIDILERTVSVNLSNDETCSIDIPANTDTYLDSVDRVLFAKAECEKILLTEI